MKIIDGKALAAKMRTALKEKIEKETLKPGLAVVLVGEVIRPICTANLATSARPSITASPS